MKTLLTLSVALFFFSATHAQGALQFSRVLLVTTIDEVPEGTVWKIEGVAGARVIKHDPQNSNSTPSLINPAHSSILINGTTVEVGSPAVGASTANSYNYGWNTLYANIPTTFPLWLPEGTTLAVSDNVSYISVIEFTVQ